MLCLCFLSGFSPSDTMASPQGLRDVSSVTSQIKDRSVGQEGSPRLCDWVGNWLAWGRHRWEQPPWACTPLTCHWTVMTAHMLSGLLQPMKLRFGELSEGPLMRRKCVAVAGVVPLGFPHWVKRHRRWGGGQPRGLSAWLRMQDRAFRGSRCALRKPWSVNN
jgi:hypothetical protein